MNTSRDGSQHQAKDTIIFIGWIAVLLIIAACSWIFSQPVRNNFLANSVNKVLEQSGDSRRLGEIYTPDKSGYSGMGKWFTLTSLPISQAGGQVSQGTRAFIFSFFGEGTFFPCAAVINQDGRVEEFIPLNIHGERMIKRISPGILKIYARRIEGIE